MAQLKKRDTISKATSQWIAMWQQVALKLLKNYAKHFGLQGVWRKKMKKMKMNKRWYQASPRFTKLYKKLKRFSMRKVEATQTMKTF
jgi:hypothetical protein